MIGSDFIIDKNRNFMLKQALSYVESIIGKEGVGIIKINAERLLEGKDLKTYKLSNQSFIKKIFTF